MLSCEVGVWLLAKGSVFVGGEREDKLQGSGKCCVDGVLADGAEVCFLYLGCFFLDQAVKEDGCD